MLLPDGKGYHIHAGDCITHMLGKGEGDMPANSVDFAVTSPPFSLQFSHTRTRHAILAMWKT